MTSAGHVLDKSILVARQPLILYRISLSRYADLSGAGAALQGQRWNRRAQSAIYTSIDVGVPVLELLAHIPKDIIPSNQTLLKIEVQGEWAWTPTSMMDQRTQGHIRVCSTLAEAEDYFETIPNGGEPDRPFALAVPSVIVPAWNVVLYPQVKSFWEHVSLLSVEPFHFDPRLFAPEALIED